MIAYESAAREASHLHCEGDHSEAEDGALRRAVVVR